MKQFKKLKSILDDAADKDNLYPIVESLMAKGVQLSDRINSDGDTLLHYLTFNGSLALLHRLFKTKIDISSIIDIENNSGESPLYFAVVRGSQAVVSLLVHFGAQPDLETKTAGLTARTLVEYKHLPIHFNSIDFSEIIEWQVQFFLADPPERIRLWQWLILRKMPLNLPINEYDNTFVHHLIDIGDLSTIVHILPRIPKILLNCKNILGETPLIRAVQGNRQLVSHVLMNHGADPKIKDKNRLSAQHYARAGFRLEPCNIEKIYPVAADLHQALKVKEFEKVLEDCASKGIGFSTRVDECDNSLLHLICQYAPVTVIAKVLASLAPGEIDVQNSFGDTPLHQASKGNRRFLTQLLLAYKADLQKKNNAHVTSDEIIRGNADLIAFLSAKPNLPYMLQVADILERGFFNLTLYKVVQNLAKDGLLLETPIDAFDNTILHWLVERVPIYEMKRILLTTKVDLNLKNHLGETPVMIAAKVNRQAMVRLLCSLNVDLTLLDSFGRTAQQHAVRMGAAIEFHTKDMDLQTVADALLAHMRLYHVSLECMPGRQKSEFLLQEFIKFIRSSGWQYDGVGRDHNELFVLDAPSNRSYIVNCFDLAYAFAFVLRAHGLGAYLHRYKNIRSIRFTERDEHIQGEFACFDSEVQAKAFRNGFFDFNNHYVVCCMGRFLDPTFCCIYDSEDDIVSEYNYMVPHTESVTISADLKRILQSPKKKAVATLRGIEAEKQRFLNLKFITSLKRLFNGRDFDCLIRGTQIYVTEKNGLGDLIIGIEQNEIQFIAECLNTDTLAQLVLEWYRSLSSTAELTFETRSERPALDVQTRNALRKQGLPLASDHEAHSVAENKKRKASNTARI